MRPCVHASYETFMKKAKLLLSAFLLLAVSAPAYCGNALTALQFLEMGAGARYLAMGGAATAIADDSTAMYWNPALMAGIEGGAADLMHAVYDDSGVYYDWLSVMCGVSKKSAIGFSVQYFSAGSLENIETNGDVLGDFNPYDAAVSLGYAVKIKGASIGAAVKYIRSKIISETDTYAFDFGIRAPDMLNGRFKLAAAITNAGEGIKYGKETEDLPMTLKVGTGFNISDNMLIAADIGQVKGRDIYAACGGELIVNVAPEVLLALRAGYNTIAESEGLSGFSAGIGIGYKNLLIDYAFLPMGDLGDTHRASITFYF